MCPLVPVWQRGWGGGQKLFWQCLLERTTFQKGTSLNFFCTLKPRRICTTKKCCIYSHFTVLDSAGSKIYRGLVESVGMKKSAGEDDQYSYIWYIWYNIYDLIYIRWSFKHKKETLEGFHREPWKTAGWCQLCKRSPLLSEFCKKAQI